MLHWHRKKIYIGEVVMKNYMQPELSLVDFSENDVVLASEVDLTEKDYFDFSSINPWEDKLP